MPARPPAGARYDGILVTAFEPFDDHELNPTVAAAEAVAAACPGVVSAVLPVEFAAACRRTRELIDEKRPHTLIALGMAAGRTAITPERVAINVIDARIPDNAGAQPVDEPVVPGAPAAFLLTLPNKAICLALEAAEIPAALSNTAGTYVCNAVAYAGAEYAASRSWPMRTGLIHVPASTEMLTAAEGSALGANPAHADTPSLAQEVIDRAVVLTVRATAACPEDIVVPAGTIC